MICVLCTLRRIRINSSLLSLITHVMLTVLRDELTPLDNLMVDRHIVCSVYIRLCLQTSPEGGGRQLIDILTIVRDPPTPTLSGAVR